MNKATAQGQVQNGLSLKEFLAIDIQRNLTPIPSRELNAYNLAFRGAFRESMSVLDVGTGYGRFLSFYQQLGADVKVICCEPNEEHRKRLKEKHPELTVLSLTIQELESVDTYDVACVPYTLLNMFHFTDQDFILRKLCAMAKRVIVDVYVAKPSEDKKVMIEDFSLYGVNYQLTAYLRSKAWYEQMGGKMGKKTSFIWYTFTKRRWIPVEHTLVIYK